MADEARSMLDALMGGDRNAPLPSGAAVQKGITSTLSKKTKSCYDADICPLYCAWNGIDVYELFVNTKSDIGGNPKFVSESANVEFQQLPKHEQERLGFHHLLFRKLQDLVRMCDRTVSRNKEKLVQEKRGKGTAHVDYVTTVDERDVEQACRTRIDLDKITSDIHEKECELNKVMEQEEKLQEQYQKQELIKKKSAHNPNDNGKADASMGSASDEKKNAGGETESKNDEKEEVSNENGDAQDSNAGESSKEAKKDADTTTDAAATNDLDQQEEDSAPSQEQQQQQQEEQDDEESPLKMEMQELLLKRQRLLFDLARAMQHYAPIQQAMEQQMEQLNFVKSDITSDKTVCQVSGNFMSARDADERIAAHYAGKQYVGWKLVRDKLKEMIAEYGRYGPPPGESGAARGGSSGGGDDRYGGGGGRGRSGDRYGRNDGGRWEPGGRGYGDGRRGGSYRDDRGGGYNRGHYGGGGDYQRHGGGGGGRDRWRR